MNHLHRIVFLRDEDYLLEIRSGGPRAAAAMETMYLTHRHRIDIVVRRLIASHPEYKGVAEDLVHDSFIILIQKIKSGSADMRSLSNFWIGIAKNVFLNDLRKDRRIHLIGEPDTPYGAEEHTPESLYAFKEEHALMEYAFAQLGSTCRKVLLMWIERYPMKEIASHLGLANAAMARKIKYQCFKKLKDIVRDGMKMTEEDKCVCADKEPALDAINQYRKRKKCCLDRPVPYGRDLPGRPGRTG